ncbi:S-phase kinase-associated protein 1, partial [Trichinella pseudospiralis]
LTIMSPFVKVISNEGETFEVDIKAIKMSQTVKTMFEALGVDENRNDLEPIPFPLVDSATLKKAADYLEIQSLRKIAGIFVHHQITGKPLKRI